MSASVDMMEIFHSSAATNAIATANTRRGGIGSDSQPLPQQQHQQQPLLRLSSTLASSNYLLRKSSTALLWNEILSSTSSYKSQFLSSHSNMKLQQQHPHEDAHHPQQEDSMHNEISNHKELHLEEHVKPTDGSPFALKTIPFPSSAYTINPNHDLLSQSDQKGSLRTSSTRIQSLPIVSSSNPLLPSASLPVSVLQSSSENLNISISSPSTPSTSSLSPSTQLKQESLQKLEKNSSDRTMETSDDQEKESTINSQLSTTLLSTSDDSIADDASSSSSSVSSGRSTPIICIDSKSPSPTPSLMFPNLVASSSTSSISSATSPISDERLLQALEGISGITYLSSQHSFLLGLLMMRLDNFPAAIQYLKHAEDAFSSVVEVNTISKNVGNRRADLQTALSFALSEAFHNNTSYGLPASASNEHSPAASVAQTDILSNEIQDLLESKQLLKRAIMETDGQREDIWNHLALLLCKMGNVPSALHLYNILVSTFPTSSSLWNNLGAIHLLGNDLESATECFQRLLANDPAHIVAMNNYAILLMERNDLETAKNILLLAIRLDEQHSLSWLNLAHVYRKLNELALVTICLSKAQQYQRRNNCTTYKFSLSFNVASHLIDLSRTERNDALRETQLRTAIQLLDSLHACADVGDPNLALLSRSGDAYGYLSLIASDSSAKSQAFLKAEEMYQRSILMNNSYEPAINGLGVLYLQHSKFEQAVSIFLSSIAVDTPSHSILPTLPMLNNLAIAAFLGGNAEQAAQICEASIVLCQAVQNHPSLLNPPTSFLLSFATLHNTLGNIHRNENRLDDALVSYENCLNIVPVHVLALSNMAIIYAARRELDTCEEYAKAALSIDESCTLAQELFDWCSRQPRSFLNSEFN